MRSKLTTAMACAGGLILAPAVQGQTVTLIPTRDGVTAEYRLDKSVDRAVFAAPDSVRTDWAAATPGVTLDAHGVTSAFSSDRFVLKLRPDSTEDGRGYIALTRLGEGYVLHAPALAMRNGPGLSLKFALPPGWVAQPDGPFDGYLYLGPKANVTARPGGARHIAARGPANPVTTRMLDTFDGALAFFGARFGPPPRSAIMSVTQSGAGPMLLRGDVTDSGLISIRFHGADDASAETMDLATRVSFHETAHLWNSHLARPAEGSPWLHEGGAEYLALVGLASTGRIDQAQALASLSQRLSDCRTGLATRQDAPARISAGPAVYDCGTVIQWLADMELRRRGDPAGIVTIWTKLIERARAGSPDYGPADFTARLEPSSAAMSLLGSDPGARWNAVDDALRTLGVRWRNAPSSQSLMVAALRHLNTQVCPAGVSRGFSWRDGSIELGNDAACGPLAGEIVLEAIEGHDVLTATSAMFDAVQNTCAKREAVHVLRRGSKAPIIVPCKSDLATPIAYALTQAPPIAL